MSASLKSIVSRLGSKKTISELAVLLDTKLENQVLLTFDELFSQITSGQKLSIKALLGLNPEHIGTSVPFLGIEEPIESSEFKMLKDRVEDPETGEITNQTRAVPFHIYSAFLKMNTTIEKEGFGRLEIASAYRSPARQALLIFYYLDLFDFDAERVFSRVALPGYSEHGLISETALDLDYTLEHPKDYDDQLFAKRDEYEWLLSKANGFGFYLSYPLNNEYGMDFEPWHWRFQSKIG